MDIHIHIGAFILWWALYFSIIWMSIGVSTSGPILFWVWYNGYDIVIDHIKANIVALLLGPIMIYMLIRTINEEGFESVKYNIRHNLQRDSKIIIHGRKSPRVLRILTKDD